MVILFLDSANVKARASQVLGHLAMEEETAYTALCKESLERVLTSCGLRAAWSTVIAHERFHLDSGRADVRAVPGGAKMLWDLRLDGRL